MRAVKTVQDVVDKVVATEPNWNRNLLAWHAYKFLVAYRDHYLRRRKAAKRQVEADRLAAKKVALAQQNSTESSSSPSETAEDEAHTDLAH